ncbi:MAG: ribonuclease P protein component [SAR324 cluster bacterium]|nr:ribonuclease P protein component [SAR324 cluster bacterium]
MSQYTFSKRSILRKRGEIDLIFKRGTFRSLGLLRVKYLSTELGYNRFLISVSKAVGHSPFRNRVKRLVRETIRLHNSVLQDSVDVCFYVTKRPQNPVTFSYIENKIIKFFKELNQQAEASMAENNRIMSDLPNKK